MKRKSYVFGSLRRVAVVVLVIVLASCGGSGGGGDSTAVVDDAGFLAFSNFQAASVVIGQTDFVSNSSGVTAASFSGLFGNPVVDNGFLYLPDYSNSRVLGFNSIPTSNGASADFVLGQVDFSSFDYAVTQSGMGGPQSLSVDEGKLFITDYDFSRVTIYATVPITGPGSADVVVGQPDFTSDDMVVSSSGLDSPESAFAVAGKLIVADSFNNRVLIWNTVPTASGAAADIVLGQDDFISNAANDDDQDGSLDIEPTARTLNYPTGVWSDGTRLVVLDTDNNRVLIWNSFPTVNFTPADLVLGQGDFVHDAADDDNQDGTPDAEPSARTLDAPYDGVFCKNDQLFVADYDNNRILIWNTFPTSNFATADIVLGQFDFTGDASNDADQDGSDDGTPSAITLDSPIGIYVEGNKLIVADSGNNRYLIYEGL